MTTRTTVTLIDDLDGTEADETVPFRIDGATYEIDLNAHNADALRKTVTDYVAHARRVGSASTARATRRQRGPQREKQRSVTATRTQPTPAASTSAPNGASGLHPEERKHVRAWARRAGYQVGDRGRIPAEVLEAYRAHRAPAAR